jgi:hypothetical protein
VQPELDDTHEAPAGIERTATLAPRRDERVRDGDLPAGMRLGHFRIVKKLGAGGMGEVYLAEDLALDRPVAIKVLPSHVASGAARDALVREARAQARVQHPNVAHIYFIGEDDGRLYFAMEYVAGKTLSERIASGPLPVEEALSVIRAAALGLREAQRSGFTHRDVKPSNLMVDGHGVVKVVDFGLVAGAPDHAGAGPVEQTRIGGTPLYMAPEQARGEPIDFRADIYALGATLYHLVAGRPPFVAESAAELVTLHETAERPSIPRGANPRTTVRALDALIAKMMAPRREDRFESYDELVRAIELASVHHTRPGGFWVRSIATGIDLVAVAIVLSILHLPVKLLGGVELELDVLVPCVAALLRAASVARWGTTAGKALFELEVVSQATGERPRFGQALRRELALGALPILGTLCAYVSGYVGSLWLTTVFAVFTGVMALTLIGALALAAYYVPGKRARWDRMAGTIVRYRSATSRALATGSSSTS